MFSYDMCCIMGEACLASPLMAGRMIRGADATHYAALKNVIPQTKISRSWDSLKSSASLDLNLVD